jgi:transposase
LTSREQERLRHLVHNNKDVRIVRRAQVIRLSSRGKTPRQIADIVERSYSGVRKTINRFNVEGFASLADKPRKSRLRKRTERYVALLKEAVQISPRDLGYPFSAWTRERLREYLARRKTYIVLSPPRLSRLMAENDIVYRRPKYGMEHRKRPAKYTCETRRNTTRRRRFWS